MGSAVAVYAGRIACGCQPSVEVKVRISMDRLLPHVPRRARSSLAVLLLMIGDILAVSCALVMSLALRFEEYGLNQILRYYLLDNTLSLVLGLALYVGIFVAFRLYRCAWRFASLEMLWGVIYAVTCAQLGMIGLRHLVGAPSLSYSVIINFWVLSIVFVGGVRVLLRLASLGQNYGQWALSILRRDLRGRRAVILGAGSHGARLLHALQEELEEPYDVIGFLDDRPEKKGIYIRRTRVLGPLSHLYELLAQGAVDEVFIALPGAGGDEIREYVMACRKRKIPVKIVPTLCDVLSGKPVAKVADFSVEDLLRRPRVCVDIATSCSYVAGKRVLVTGAGGSIGSELCRQLMHIGPSELVLLGHGENSIHRIQQELVNSFPHAADRLRVVIASVADEARIDQVFRQYKPQVVFHAAAHKHVPIMEDNLLEAVQNNVIGTNNIVAACGRYGVQKMVLISTDKAVNPSSVMGATKWLCEQIVCASALKENATSYVTVRFGNVLGSRGSVVLLFHEQIKRGGPVTVTHPEMTRYFMLIPEAVQLVLQAAAIGRSGDLFLLEMGKPVRITDLAKDMIRLCGYEPEVDIPIEYSGIRPGEKLHERLVMDNELLEHAECEGLLIVRRAKYLSATDCAIILRRITDILERGDTDDMHALLTEVVPEFGKPDPEIQALPIAGPYDSVARA